MGHPDYQNNVSSPGLVFVANVGTFAPGSVWGGTAYVMPSGGCYEILVQVVGAGAKFGITDVYLNHLDVNGNTVYQDAFTVGAGTQANGYGGAILRGNMHGVKLQITGQTATTAYLTAIGITGETHPSLQVTLYSQGLAVAQPRPKVSPLLAGVIAPQLDGMVFTSINLPASGTTILGAMQSYSGLCKLTMYTGTANPDYYVQLNTYTVAGGTTAAWILRPFSNPTQSVPVTEEIMIDQLFHVAELVNKNANAQTTDTLFIPIDFI